MRINHNLMAMNTQRQLGVNNESTGKSLEKLSSGLRINRAGDDAAGLAISEKMRGQIRGLTQASRNSQDGISLIQTAEGALNETHDILQRMRELAVQSANDTNVGVDRGEVQKELNQLTSEVNRIGNTTEYNTMKLLNGDRSEAFDTGKTVVGALAQTAAVLAAGLSASTGALTLKDNKVTIATVAGEAAWNAAATGAITIQKNASGALQVDIALGEGSGAASANRTMSDKIDVAFDSSGNYTYDKHGVSFTINKADFDLAGAGSGSIQMDLDVNKSVGGNTATDFTGNYAVKADGKWTVNTGNATIDAITVDANKVDKNIAKVTVSFTTGATSFSIILQDASGNTLVKDATTGLSGAGSNTLAYNSHGISFNIAAATGSGSLTVDLKMGTKAVTEDRSLSFQVGANENQAMTLGVTDLRSVALGIASKTAGGSFNTGTAAITDGTNSKAVEFSLDVSSHDAAAKSVTILQNAIEKVSAERSKLGAVQNRLEHTIKNLDTSSENLQAAESRIRDVDMAKEMMNYKKNDILQQAAQAMLAQANQSTQGVLQLLR